ncbi:hypothetical protein BX616_005847 [Lobosporangium transversale]|uniref:Uncharacterized protein n=1 Tax=Lobosporangium transversale TaxID=64571 RepID=A0A1Y2GTY1_9FUNG|nr:hypothetical protein BCR41DRAFT_394012 [Lobosporangium transversale]KAF9897296.1 hypothetical protein BX616_005847 [Lobosporangium transversale]ORZ23700.1 hypothetical protein BCR41DRAFT_394012 [Lobosporangium transversale]|eukprot:XP_021883514.1 hypothetical protein BCR41DRAFT_394012 [Lobosporangium transversale]
MPHIRAFYTNRASEAPSELPWKRKYGAITAIAIASGAGAVSATFTATASTNAYAAAAAAAPGATDTTYMYSKTTVEDGSSLPSAQPSNERFKGASSEDNEPPATSSFKVAPVSSRVQEKIRVGSFEGA